MKKIILGIELSLLLLFISGRDIFATEGIFCAGGDSINTAIGCIPFKDPTGLGFMSFFLRWGIGIGGGIALALIILAGFQIITSTGNPERLKAGQELLTSALTGLIMLIFSVFILRIIGVDLLGVIK
jgi:hypothetical protein